MTAHLKHLRQYEGGAIFAPVIFHGGTGQAKHVRALEWMRDHWPSKIYVDDIPVIIRLDKFDSSDDAYRCRLTAFVQLVQAGICAIGVAIGTPESIRASFEEHGVSLPDAVEMISVEDAQEFYAKERQLGLRWAE